LQTVHYFIDPTWSDDVVLKICNQATMQLCNTYQAIDATGAVNDDMASPMTVHSQKYFVVTLPEGQYEATFMDGHRSWIWPRFFLEQWRPVHCKGTKSGHLEEGHSFWLPFVPPSTKVCTGNLLPPNTVIRMLGSVT
jgi:hypothetical protein